MSPRVTCKYPRTSYCRYVHMRDSLQMWTDMYHSYYYGQILLLLPWTKIAEVCIIRMFHILCKIKNCLCLRTCLCISSAKVSCVCVHVSVYSVQRCACVCMSVYIQCKALCVCTCLRISSANVRVCVHVSVYPVQRCCVCVCVHLCVYPVRR